MSEGIYGLSERESNPAGWHTAKITPDTQGVGGVKRFKWECSVFSVARHEQQDFNVPHISENLPDIHLNRPKYKIFKH